MLLGNFQHLLFVLFYLQYTLICLTIYLYLTMLLHENCFIFFQLLSLNELYMFLYKLFSKLFHFK